MQSGFREAVIIPHSLKTSQQRRSEAVRLCKGYTSYINYDLLRSRLISSKNLICHAGLMAETFKGWLEACSSHNSSA